MKRFILRLAAASPLALAILAATLLGVALGAGIDIAWAQAVPAPAPDPSTVVSFAGLFKDVILPAVVAVILALASWATRKVPALIGVNLSEQNKASLDAMLDRAVHWGAMEVASMVDSRKLTDIDVRSAIVATALNYATKLSGDLVEKNGGGQYIETRIKAQLAQLLGIDAIAAVAAGPQLTAPVQPAAVAPAAAPSVGGIPIAQPA